MRDPRTPIGSVWWHQSYGTVRVTGFDVLGRCEVDDGILRPFVLTFSPNFLVETFQRWG